MTDRKLSDDEARVLWREAARRLRAVEVEVEPPLMAGRVEALQAQLGPRRPGQSLRDWLRGEGARADGDDKVVALATRRPRLRPVATFTRLAADTAGTELALPEGELESQDGQFRLRASLDGDAILLELQALGFTADYTAGRTVALVSHHDEEAAAATVELDEDGDGTGRFADTSDLRRALLRPVIALVEDR